MLYSMVECVGLVYFRHIEKRLLETAPVFNLSKKAQLSFCDILNLNPSLKSKKGASPLDEHRIYTEKECIGTPGINYDRLTHSFQVLSLATTNLKNYNKNPEIVEKVRVGALLHDMDHTSFSHTLEGDGNITPEQRAEKLILKTEIADVLKDGGLDPEEILDMVLHRTKEYEAEVIHGDVGVDRGAYVMMDTKRYFNEFYPTDSLEIFPNLFENVDGEACLPLMYDTESLCDEPVSLKAAWNLLKGRTRLFTYLYGSLNNRAATTLLRNAVQISLEERTIEDEDLFELYDVQLLSKLKQGSNKIRTLVENLERGNLPLVKLDVNLISGSDIEYIKNLREKRDERLEIEEKIGEDVYIDITPLGTGPKGDMKVLLSDAEMNLEEACKLKNPRYDIARLRVEHTFNVNNRLVMFSYSKEDLQEKAIETLGINPLYDF